MKQLVVILICLFYFNTLHSQCNEINTVAKDGEWFKYDACYNWHFIWLNAGEVIFRTNKTIYNNNPAYKFEAIGRTYNSYDFFYTVRDTFSVLTDTISLSPYRFKQSNYEGKNITSNEYIYDSRAKRITGFSELTHGKHTDKRKIDMMWPQNSFDVMTMVHKVRNINFDKYAIGEKIPIRMLINAENFNLYIRYLGRETITTRYGRTFKCIKISPLLVEGTIFKGGEDMMVWISDDRNRVPIVVEAKILIGSVKAMFVDAGGLRYPFDSEIKDK